MKQETIDEIRKALERATPGPWFHFRHPDYKNSWHKIDAKAGNMWGTFAHPACMSAPNASLVCLLRNHAPALLDEIERLTARVAEQEVCRNKTCTWKPYREHRKKDNMLKTSCGYVSCNSERYGKYCPYCGGKIEEDES